MKQKLGIFLELSCFYLMHIGNLISGSSAFSRSSLCIWKLAGSERVRGKMLLHLPERHGRLGQGPGLRARLLSSGGPGADASAGRLGGASATRPRAALGEAQPGGTREAPHCPFLPPLPGLSGLPWPAGLQWPGEPSAGARILQGAWVWGLGVGSVPRLCSTGWPLPDTPGSAAHLGVSEQCILSGDSCPAGPPSPRSGSLRETARPRAESGGGPCGEGAERVQRPCWVGSGGAGLACFPRAEPAPLASSKDSRSRGRGCRRLGHARGPPSTTPWMQRYRRGCCGSRGQHV